MRIYPLFITMLILWYLLHLLGFENVISSPNIIVQHLLLIKGENIFWSIPVEFKYYILSPFLMIIFKKCYFKIDIDNKSQLDKIKLTKKYDIGFHKLSFIIKENIISSFKKGLINDHWGALPFVKGRSTLLYSKLLGVPQIITTHLIEKNIDSGKIINYYPLKNKHIKLQILSGLNFRILESLHLLSKMKFREAGNTKSVIFYEMHPWLIKKINKFKL